MKKKTIIAIIILITLVTALFPIPTTHKISGTGEVLNLQKEKIGTCELEVEIKKVSSLTICYKRSFSFILNGNAVETFSTTSYSDAGELCLHSQMYYNEKTDMMDLASLIYPKDLSYVVLDLDSNYYFINNGSSLTYAELPLYQKADQ